MKSRPTDQASVGLSYGAHEVSEGSSAWHHFVMMKNCYTLKHAGLIPAGYDRRVVWLHSMRRLSFRMEGFGPEEPDGRQG